MTAGEDDLDCGDNSCVFAARKGGMRTNGGCRCLSDLPSAFRRQLTRHILAQRDRLKEITIERDEAQAHLAEVEQALRAIACGGSSDRMLRIAEEQLLGFQAPPSTPSVSDGALHASQIEAASPMPVGDLRAALLASDYTSDPHFIAECGPPPEKRPSEAKCERCGGVGVYLVENNGAQEVICDCQDVAPDSTPDEECAECGMGGGCLLHDDKPAVPVATYITGGIRPNEAKAETWDEGIKRDDRNALACDIVSEWLNTTERPFGFTYPKLVELVERALSKGKRTDKPTPDRPWLGERDEVCAWSLQQFFDLIDGHLDPSGHFHLSKSLIKEARRLSEQVKRSRTRVAKRVDYPKAEPIDEDERHG